MTLTLIRHGETNLNRLEIIQGRIDTPLNETGKKQAKAFNTTEKFAEIGASSLSRALETANIIKTTLNHHKSILIVPDFIERDFGELDNVDFSLAQPKLINNGFIQGFEDDESLTKRVLNGVYKLYKIYKDQNILIVAHSHTIKALLVHVEPNKYSFINYRFKNLETFKFQVSETFIKII